MFPTRVSSSSTRTDADRYSRATFHQRVKQVRARWRRDVHGEYTKVTEILGVTTTNHAPESYDILVYKFYQPGAYPTVTKKLHEG